MAINAWKTLVPKSGSDKCDTKYSSERSACVTATITGNVQTNLSVLTALIKQGTHLLLTTSRPWLMESWGVAGQDTPTTTDVGNKQRDTALLSTRVTHRDPGCDAPRKCLAGQLGRSQESEKGL